MAQDIEQRRHLLQTERICLDVEGCSLDELFDSLLSKLEVFFQFEIFEIGENVCHVKAAVGFDQKLEVDNSVNITTVLLCQANLDYRGKYHTIRTI